MKTVRHGVVNCIVWHMRMKVQKRKSYVVWRNCTEALLIFQTTAACPLHLCGRVFIIVKTFPARNPVSIVDVRSRAVLVNNLATLA
jgi:hypothetical protein